MNRSPGIDGRTARGDGGLGTRVAQGRMPRYKFKNSPKLEWHVASTYWSRFGRLLALVGSALLMSQVGVAAQSSPGAATQEDPLSAMFSWWNGAMKTPGAFTEEGFAVYFTDDAPLIIDGVEVMRGPAGWAERFQMIQQMTEAVEIVLPFRYSFQQDDRIYTYHIIRSRAQGKVSCMVAAGHADLVDGKIGSVTLVRAEIDPATDPDCWRE
jgi:hypothetical protein